MTAPTLLIVSPCNPRDTRGSVRWIMLAADAPEKIRYWVKERKLSGLRVYTGGLTNKQSTSLSDPKTFPGWECAGELGIPVCVSLRPEGLPQLMVLIKQFPQVRIIVDHLMDAPIEEGPPYAGSEPLFDLAGYGNVYLKLTTINIRALRKGQSIARDLFPLAREEVWCFPYCLGFKLSCFGRDPERDSEGSEVDTCGSAAAGSGMDSWPHGSISLSHPCGPMRGGEFDNRGSYLKRYDQLATSHP